MKKLGLYLLSYKRPDLFKEALDSLLQQNYDDFEIIVSENSPDESVTSVLNNYLPHPKIKVTRRAPSLASLEHFNTIIHEASNYEYVMFFHDDDILLPNAAKALTAALDQNSDSVGAACNAFITKDTTSTELLLCPRMKEDLTISTQAQLMRRHFFRRLDHPPFPSYIYRAKFIKGLTLETKDGGKYSDVAFLIKLIERGKFIWLHQPLMYYRIHQSNDSAQHSLGDIAKLCWFCIKTQPIAIPILFFYFGRQVVKKTLTIIRSY